MGVVARQGFKALLASFVGLAIGMLNVLILYPQFLRKEQYGFVQFLFEASMLFAVLAQMGTPQWGVRFKAHYADQNRSADFFAALMVVALVGVVAFTALLFVFREPFKAQYREASSLVAQFYYFVPLMAGTLVFQNLLEGYCRAHSRVAVPTFLRDTFHKLLNGGLIVAYGSGWLSWPGFLTLLSLSYGVNAGILTVYLLKNGWLKLRPVFVWGTWRRFFRELSYGLATFLATIGNSIAVRIDMVMIPMSIFGGGLAWAAIYGMAIRIARLIELPLQAISGAVAGGLAEAAHRADTTRLGRLLRQSSVSLTAVNVFLALCIQLALPVLYSLVPNREVYLGGVVIVSLRLAMRVFTGLFGVINEVLLYSQHHRWFTATVFGLALFNAGLNYFFLLEFGFLGAAYATFISLVVMFLTRGVLVYRFFGIQPFSRNLVGILGLGGLVYLALGWVPWPELPPGAPLTDPAAVLPVMLGLLGLFGAVCLLYGLPLLGFRLAPEINRLLLNGLRRFRR